MANEKLTRPLRSVGLAAAWIGWAFILMFGPVSASGVELEEARKKFIGGDYAECIRLCEQAILEKERDEDWPILLAKSLLETGKYPEAQAAIAAALKRSPYSIRIRLIGREVCLHNGQREPAAILLQEINELGGSRRWGYRDPANLVALGRAALLLGADPRLVLENFFDTAKKADPKYREAYTASGEVALAKYDYALAAKIFEEGLKQFPEEPDFHFGRAKAYAPSDRPEMLWSLETALRHNTNHVPSLLLLADHLIDAEEYAAAEETVAQALAVNPHSPEAWAYRSVLHHVRGEPEGEAHAHQQALAHWNTNPEVDYLIGQKISQKYRFAEGSGYQRQALRFDPKFLPAKIQLAQDLLRLGEENEGWHLAEEVYHADPYDVAAYNLVTLQESIAKFQTLTNDDFIVRMSPHEAAVYGQEVLRLLGRAKTNLCQKYGLKLNQPTTVEIFPEQKDFAVRTFGMPGGAGFLGVCFGSVITANSPASQAANPANWQAVLWHEFCHVVTLQLTRNRMPRWLSEGISVYEERQANPAWGQSMGPRYRELIMGSGLKPVQDLSAAFLSAKGGEDLQFAYYESSLVVEFLIRQFGLERLQQLLAELALGTPSNQALEKRLGPLDDLERDFAAFAREQAEQLAPGLNWEKPAGRLPIDDEAGWELLHPNNYWALIRRGKKLIAERKWEEAKAPLQKLLELYPEQTGADNAYALLAEAHRALGETEPERETLAKLAARDADAVEAFLRLMELAALGRDWPAAARNAQRLLAVNPLLPQPHRYLGRASEEQGKREAAISSYRTLLLLDPPEAAEIHFRLARLLHQTGDPAAKRHVLQALEEAPRFRDAHRLLLDLSRPGAH